MNEITIPRGRRPILRTGKPTIYLAGKISKNDWRTAILGYRAGALENGEGGDEDRFLFDPSYRLDHEWFWYGGPFFIACDHGCSHGRSTHGANPYCHTKIADPDIRQPQIWKVNRERLRRADIVFAYIDAVDCHGTLIEIGLAAAWGKRLIVGFSESLTAEQYNDLWMARQGASATFRGPVKSGWGIFATGLAP